MQIEHTPGVSANPYMPGRADRRPLYPAPGEVVQITATVEDAGGYPPELIYAVAPGPGRGVWPSSSGNTLTYEIGPFPAGAQVEYRIGDEIAEGFTVGRESAAAGIEEVELSASRAAYTVRFEDGSALRREVTLHAEKDATARISSVSESGALCIEAGKGAPEESELLLLSHPEWVPQKRLVVRHQRREKHFCGFGERYNAVNQLGAALDTRVYEEYKEQHLSTRTYMPVPFFMTDRRWGLYVESDQRVRFDMDSRNSATWSYSVPLDDAGLSARSHVYCGSPAAILRSYAEQSGMPDGLPGWVFGPWMSSNEWNSQARVMEEVGRSKELDIPATVLVIEAWSDEKNFYIWNDAQYSPRPGDERFSYDDFRFPSDGLWPNPKEMVRTLHEDGVRLLLWQIPVLKHMDEPDAQNSNDLHHMLSNGFAVTTRGGEPYRVRPWWFTDGHVVDFGYPEAARWWMEKRRYLLEELGVDGFKTDGGEHLWGDDVIGHGALRGDALANRYPREYLKSYYAEARAHGGVLFSRAGSAGAQSTPLHWAGDQNSTWREQRSVLRAVLNAGISGIPFVGWDLAGFSGPLPEAELYIRGAEAACFGTIMQYHSEFNEHRTPHVDRTPWNVAERTGRPEVVELYRYYAKLRMRLIPYLEECARESTNSAAPVMRPLFYAHPDDPRCWEIDDQYLLGPDLLVAPVLEPRRTARQLYLPAGDWVDAWTGRALAGEQELSAEAPMDRIPLFVRKEHSAALEGLFPLVHPALVAGGAR